MAHAPSLSLVVPVLNEEENVVPLVKSVQDVLTDEGSWELILVDDGSTDRTPDLVRSLGAQDPRVRLVRLARRYGQSTAMQAGFDHVRGSVVVTMDGDLQNDPRDIPRLVAELDRGYDLVAGYRERRQDHLLRRKVPSWIANRIIRWVTGVSIRDNGCSLKAYRGDLLSRVRLYSDMHRFIPALAAGVAAARITEVPVRHHPRTRGHSKYGLSRVARVLADLLTIKMITSFRLRPLALFSSGAAASSLLGLVSAGAAAVSAWHPPGDVGPLVVYPAIALVWFALAFYLVMLGLVAEVALRSYPGPATRTPPLLREVRA